jgi:hypothetical protein
LNSPNEIDHVDTHVAHGPVARLGAVHAPGDGRFLVRPAGPHPAHVDVEDAAEKARLGHDVQALHRRDEPPVEARHGGALRALGRRDHVAPFLRRHGQRLLAEDVRAFLEGGHGDLAVERGRRGDHHDVGLRLLEHVLPPLEHAGYAVASGDLAGDLLVALADRHHLAAVALEGGNVGATEAEPDDADGAGSESHDQVSSLDE